MVMLIIGNNYVDSEWHSIPSGAPGAVGLGASFSTVKESGNWPLGQGGTKNFVCNRGQQNRVVGEPASKLDSNPGLGRRMQLRTLAGMPTNSKEHKRTAADMTSVIDVEVEE